MAGRDPEGGDPACWLEQVCEHCGRLVEDAAAHRCEAAPGQTDDRS